MAVAAGYTNELLPPLPVEQPPAGAAHAPAAAADHAAAGGTTAEQPAKQSGTAATPGAAVGSGTSALQPAHHRGTETGGGAEQAAPPPATAAAPADLSARAEGAVTERSPAGPRADAQTRGAFYLAPGVGRLPAAEQKARSRMLAESPPPAEWQSSLHGVLFTGRVRLNTVAFFLSSSPFCSQPSSCG